MRVAVKQRRLRVSGTVAGICANSLFQAFSLLGRSAENSARKNNKSAVRESFLSRAFYIFFRALFLALGPNKLNAWKRLLR